MLHGPLVTILSLLAHSLVTSCLFNAVDLSSQGLAGT